MDIKKKKIWLSVIFIIILLFVVAGVVFFRGKRNDRTIVVPRSFLDARFDSALVSKRIVELTRLTNEDIKAINVSDLNGNANEARELIKKARVNNTEAYQRAFELSQHLRKLAESLGELSSNKSQRLAYEAVAIQLSLVSEFINYTQNLNRFFDNLDRAISTNTNGARADVYSALRDVNTSTDAINKLNNDFLAKMKKFDGSL